MLVLSRKPGESIEIDGPATFIYIRQEGQKIRVGIQAAPDVRIKRSELTSIRPDIEHREVAAKRQNFERLKFLMFKHLESPNRWRALCRTMDTAIPDSISPTILPSAEELHILHGCWVKDLCFNLWDNVMRELPGHLCHDNPFVSPHAIRG
jgi:carbon storage regulator CsrA